MALVINTNISAIKIQSDLDHSNDTLATSLQRLSTGLRINSAKDDAAGLAISERFTSQINGLKVAARNTNDGISLTQTAESALGTISDSLQRIRELAIQSINATNSSSDRQALNAEVQQLKEAINHTATTTQFNDIALLDGSFVNQDFQVGSNVGDVLTLLGIDSAHSSRLAETSTASHSPPSNISENLGFLLWVDLVFNGTSTTPEGKYQIEDELGNRIDIGEIVLDTEALTNGEISFSEYASEAVNQISNQTGVYATVIDGGFSIKLDSTHDIKLYRSFGTLSLIDSPAVVTDGFSSLDISTVFGSVVALDSIDLALDEINSARATMGALQSRFESVANNLGASEERLTEARSRIRDTDFAFETAALVRGQILQQAAVSMLAQATVFPENVLSLLQNF